MSKKDEQPLEVEDLFPNAQMVYPWTWRWLWYKLLDLLNWFWMTFTTSGRESKREVDANRKTGK